MSGTDVNWQTVALFEELDESWPHSIDVAGKSIALYRIGDTVYATAGLCTHMAQALADGLFDPATGTIECPLHQARFDVTTGAALCPPAKDPLRVYPVRVVEGEVQVDLSLDEMP